MSRKFSILVAFCVVLFGAILAGYWDMLDSEKLRSVRDQATASVAELTGTRSDSTSDGPETAAPASGADASPAAPGSSAGGEAAAPAAGEGVSGSGKDSREAALRPPGAPTGAQPSAGSVQGPAKAPPSPTTPSFDILRVEPDGSAVLAGRAAPNAEVRLLDGGRTIGRAKATPSGDFAIVLDERLAAGDHQIRIEAERDGGKRDVSQETAIVSVPRPGDPGELLAMVESPNRPSRIINLPSGVPSAPGAAPQPGIVANAVPAPPAPSVDTGRDITSAPAGNASAAGSPAPGRPSAAPSSFAVEAVEIENGTVYIAGRAPGAAPVRVYIDDKLIGEDARRANGRFLVTAKVPLAVGNHQIRADMIKGGGVVASRVEVPFARPDGDAMSAVASNDAGDRAKNSTALQRPDVPADRTGVGAPAATGGNQGAPAPSTAPPAAAPGEGAAASEPSGNVASAGSGTGDATTATDADGGDGIATIRQPTLESVNSRVLIRRGDTLWRISRQTYGAGHRYSVIYVANGDQIRNPNRIYPGQVFRLPKDEPTGGEGAPTAIR